MSFTFLHAADLHLGSPLLGLTLKDVDVAKRFAMASREAFSDLVTRAVEIKVSFVVIAGARNARPDFQRPQSGILHARRCARLRG